MQCTNYILKKKHNLCRVPSEENDEQNYRQNVHHAIDITQIKKKYMNEG